MKGIDMAVAHKITVPFKTVVCGHYTTSYGHAVYGSSSRPGYGVGANYSPFYADGIIALDGQVFYSGILNCVVIEDNDL